MNKTIVSESFGSLFRSHFSLRFSIPLLALVLLAATASGQQQATGGVLTNYTQGGIVYFAHIFTNTGATSITFQSACTVDYLIVGGGGGKERSNTARADGGSGGGGGYLDNTEPQPGGNGTAGQGFKGGAAVGNADGYKASYGGGGGGAGSPGTDGKLISDPWGRAEPAWCLRSPVLP